MERVIVQLTNKEAKGLKDILSTGITNKEIYLKGLSYFLGSDVMSSTAVPVKSKEEPVNNLLKTEVPVYKSTYLCGCKRVGVQALCETHWSE